MTALIKAFISAYKTTFSEDQKTKTLILFVIQTVLTVLLTGTIVMVCMVNTGQELIFYLLLVMGLVVLLFLAIWFNLKTDYHVSAWITIIITIIGPWVSIFMVGQGDFVPIIYIALSIQLCSILLSEKGTLIVGLLQFVALIVFLLSSPALMRLNWLSIVAFVVFSSTVGIVSSFANRKKMEQIEKNRSRLEQSEAMLRMMAERDALTGLYNRRYMEETLSSEVDKALSKNESVSIIMADINDFKTINDTYGHASGDAVLRFVAEIFKTHTTSSDIACRYGGDEFVIILPNCPLQQAVDQVKSFCRILGSVPFRYEGRDIGHIYLSFGIAALPEHGRSGEQLLRMADKSMYADKNRRKDRQDAPHGYRCFVLETTNMLFCEKQLDNPQKSPRECS